MAERLLDQHTDIAIHLPGTKHYDEKYHFRLYRIITLCFRASGTDI